jgi:hypothetical protein
VHDANWLVVAYGLCSLLLGQ